MPLKNEERYAIANLSTTGDIISIIGRYYAVLDDAIEDLNWKIDNAAQAGYPGLEKRQAVIKVSTIYEKV